MKLVKKSVPDVQVSQSAGGGLLGRTIDRRAFLRRTGLAAGGAAVAIGLPARMMKRADAASDAEGKDGETVGGSQGGRRVR